MGESKSRLEYWQLFNHSGGKWEVDAVEHPDKQRPSTHFYSGEDEPLSGQQTRPHGVAARWEREVSCAPCRAARTREDEEATAVITERPGTKSQHLGGEMLLDLVLQHSPILAASR